MSHIRKKIQPPKQTKKKGWGDKTKREYLVVNTPPSPCKTRSYRKLLYAHRHIRSSDYRVETNLSSAHHAALHMQSVKADLCVILMYPNLFISTIAAVIAVIISANNSSQTQFHIHCYRPPFDHPTLKTICRLAVVKPVAAVAFLPPDPWEKRLAIQGKPTEWQSPHQINITYLSPSLPRSALHSWYSNTPGGTSECVVIRLGFLLYTSISHTHTHTHW